MIRIPEPIQVLTYAGSRGDERPRAFASSTGALDVVQILERWYQQDLGRRQKDYFRVLASDGETYILYRDRSLDLWFLETRGSPPRGGGPHEAGSGGE
ncbi:MAG: hypothetical protein ACE5G5_02770 [Candidatus Methylomirabilales bacterium]